MHDSASSHVSGESEFVDDRPFTAGELHVDVVYCPYAKARIKKIDLTAAKKVPGAVAFFTHEDLHHNRWGTIFQDQPLLAESVCEFAGEAVVVVAAESKDALLEAKRLVKIDYEELRPILSIDEAKEQKQFLGFPRQIERGDPTAALANASHKLSGQVRMAGQDHFYLESQVSIVYPKENGQLEIHSSSQHPTEVQHVVAHALGLNFHDIVCIVKRMGGAFGGKESQGAPFAAYGALVALKTKRAARIVLSKDDDMIMTGKRNPFQNDYDVAFDDEGRILALDVRLFSDGGAYADLSTAIMERAMLHVDNAYYIPNIRIQGQVCKTNYHPHTAFRGFGGPKGVVTIENIIEDIAKVLNRDALEVRKLNCYQVDRNNTAPYGQTIPNNMLPKLFADLERKCDYARRRKAIAAHNAASTASIKGLSMTAVKFGIAFTTRFLNQGGALVNILTDGTVQVSTGATEMGQGVNARIASVVADSFGIPLCDVRVMPTSTEKIPNTSPTAASSGTDINAAAALAACNKIKVRLSELAAKVIEIAPEKRAVKTAALGTEPEVELIGKSSADVQFKDGHAFASASRNRKISFKDLVQEAYYNRIPLSDVGYFKYHDIHYDKTTGKGSPFFYYTQGVAASEVEIDKYTGELKVQRTDILMDLGRPIDKGLDLGQCSGGFIQGMGWVTTEAMHYEKGKLISHSPSTYKIPNIQDIPREFHIDFIDNDGNSKNVRGSKAVGEPPLLLAVSVWTAVKNALAYLKPEGEIAPLHLPATGEEIFRRMHL